MIKKTVSLSLAILLTFFMTGINGVIAAQLSSDLPVLIQADKQIVEGSNSVGDAVNFHVVNEIKDNATGKTLIKSGTPVRAKIIKLEKRKRIGRPAAIVLSELKSTAANGAGISFQGTISKESKSKMTRSIVLSALLLPFFLLMKGAPAEIPEGYQTTVCPASNYEI